MTKSSRFDSFVFEEIEVYELENDDGINCYQYGTEEFKKILPTP
jgi:hypothetical protein